MARLSGALVESSALRGAGDSLRRRADEDGYLFFRGLIDPGRVLALRRRVLVHARERGWLADATPLMDGIADAGLRLGACDDPRWIAVLCEVLPSTEFQAAGSDPGLVDVLGELYGRAPQGGHGDLCRLVSPRTEKLTTPPHRDSTYVRGARELWTAWMPLGECPVSHGALAVLPGSHKDEGEGIGDEMRWATADLRCGDVLLFAGRTLHRANPNASADRLRLSAEYRWA